MTSSTFTADEWLRYTRHIQLPQVGVEGQSKLNQAKVLVVGCGGLGSPVLFYLAAAGVGRLTILDGDRVDLTNLQRQILFTTDQVGEFKADCAKKQLIKLNPEIKIDAIKEPLNIGNANQYIQNADIVVDCTDNFSTRYLINDHCVLLKKPWLFASIYQFSGQCALFTPKKDDNSACFRCLFPEPPGSDIADCNTAGVLGVLPGILGTLQVNEVIKYLLGLPCALENTLLMVEASDLDFRKISLSKKRDCVICSIGSLTKESLVPLYGDYHLKDIDSYEHSNEISEFVYPKDLSLLIDDNKYALLDIRTNKERASFNIGGLHIPFDELGSKMGFLDKSKIHICFCQSGIRSIKAFELLKENGFDVVHLEGGLVALLKENSN